jgi:hypothetical protein
MHAAALAGRLALALLTCLLAALWLPPALDAVLGLRTVRSVALFSPILGEFLFREYLPAWQEAGLAPPEAALLEHGLAHRTAAGQALSRTAFENALPFQYAESLRVRGLLPVTIQGRAWDAETLRQGRLILGIRPADVGPARLDPGLHALLDSRPDRVNLVFPEDRFRLRGRLEFVNADHNAPDPALSQAVNDALATAGFVFPATAAYGRDTILKPFDAGWFLTDAAGSLYRLRRVRDVPEATRLAMPAGEGVAHVQVQETAGGQALGLMVGTSGTVYLLGGDLGLRPLPCRGYDPARHWLKAVIDPYGDACLVDDAGTMAATFRPANGGPEVTAGREVPSARPGPGAVVSWLVCPLRLTLTPETTSFVAPALATGGLYSALGAGLWGAVAGFLAWRRGGYPAVPLAVAWGMAGGLCGLTALLWTPRACRPAP